MLRFCLRGLLVCAGILSSNSVFAAIISITQQTLPASPDTSYNLTALGSYDWAYWNESTTSTPFNGPRAPNNSKSAAAFISDITNYNGTQIRGTTSTTAAPNYDFTYTDGTSPASGSIGNPIGLFNALLGTNGVNADAGVTLSVTAPTADPFMVYIWGTAFGSRSNLTASIGAAMQSNTDYVTATGSRAPGSLYSLLVTPDFAGQVLTVNYFLESTLETGNGHVSLSAVAVGTAVPEPGLAILAAAMLPGAWLLRRKKSAQ